MLSIKENPKYNSKCDSCPGIGSLEKVVIVFQSRQVTPAKLQVFFVSFINKEKS